MTARKLRPIQKYELRVVLVGIAVSLVGIPFGFLLQQVTTDGPLTVFDESAARWTNRQLHDVDPVIAVMHFFSFLGKPIFLMVAVGLPSLWALWHRHRKLVLFLAVTTIGGGIVDTIVKVAVGRTRPEVDEPIVEAFGNSFPSGHSMSSVVCYGALVVAFAPVLGDRWRRVAIGAFVFLVLAIGGSRLVLGVHFISDVLGGYILGAAWLIGAVAAFEVYRIDRGRRRTDPLVEGVEPEDVEELVQSGA